MADGGEAVSRSLALVDQFYLSMMECGVLKIQAFQYECFSEITEDTYSKFLEHFSKLYSSLKAIHFDVFVGDRADVECQTLEVKHKFAEKKIHTLNPQLVSLTATVGKKIVATDDIDPLSFEFPKISKSKVEPFSPVKVRKVGRPRGIFKRDPMVCDYCDFTCTSLDDIFKHTRKQHGDETFGNFSTCEICSQHFLSSEALFDHMACAHHLKEEDDALEGDAQLCAFCAELTTSWQSLSEHLTAAHNLYMCKTCHALCEDPQGLDNHITATHLTGVSQKMMEDSLNPIRKTCTLKGKSIRSGDSDIQLEPSVPKKRGRPRKVPVALDQTKIVVECTLCQMTFPSEESLRNHMAYRHESMTKDLHCKKCDLKFRRKTALENHKRIVHRNWLSSDEDEADDKPEIKEEPQLVPSQVSTSNTGLPVVVKVAPPEKKVKPLAQKTSPKPKPYKTPKPARRACEVCDEICTKVEDLEIHRDHHATSKPDKFLCLYCTVPGMPHQELRTHIISEHRYRCPFCALTFWWKANLQVHMMQLHSSRKDCPSCPLIKFETTEDMRQHFLKDHSPKKLYLCKVCMEEMASISLMHEHELTHSEALQCEICQRRFGSRTTLEGHVMRHIRSDTTVCLLCGQQFSSDQALREHMERHSKSQFVCLCGKRFAQKQLLQMHQRSNTCKKNIPSGPKADIFVEVRVPCEGEEPLEEKNCAEVKRMEGADTEGKVWQISIALPAESSARSQDFLSSLAHTVEPSQPKNPTTQPILILDSSSVKNEATLIEEQPAEIVQWLQAQNKTIKLEEEKPND